MRALGEYRTAHDLAADWDWAEAGDVVGFKVSGGRVVWTDAEYVGWRLRIGRIEPSADGAMTLRTFVRFVDPDTPIELVRGNANER